MASTTSKKPAAKYTAARRGPFVAVANATGQRVALLHPRDADRWGDAVEGKDLRKYVELTFTGEVVRNWAPLDRRIHAGVFRAAKAFVAAEAKAKKAAK